ncbi:GNAT family N-acetyltransferase [Botrimarina sp.]|uniref:GNAT family N-acetyltransferase n=1 Tax=Botrimarina sp. TaxID=2795802 RepID=UPI0032EA9300
MTPPAVAACRLSSFSDDLALATGALLSAVWPRPDRGPVERAEQLKRLGRQYDGPDSTAPIAYVVRQDDRVVAHALTFLREIEADGRTWPVMALAMVASDPACRGRGYGAAVVEAALGRVVAGAFPASLFQTSFAVEPFYERLGAVRAANRIINSKSEEPDRCPFWDDVVLRYPADADWPEGVIDLRGKGY